MRTFCARFLALCHGFRRVSARRQVESTEAIYVVPWRRQNATICEDVGCSGQFGLTDPWALPILSVGADNRGVWRSLVARGVWDAEVGGSSPLTPTDGVGRQNSCAGVTQLVECLPSKQNVAGSSPVSRSPKTLESTDVFRFVTPRGRMRLL